MLSPTAVNSSDGQLLIQGFVSISLAFHKQLQDMVVECVYPQCSSGQYKALYTSSNFAALHVQVLYMHTVTIHSKYTLQFLKLSRQKLIMHPLFMVSMCVYIYIYIYIYISHVVT